MPALKPGWRMTEAQHAAFWRMWREACLAQGWINGPTVDRERRRVLAELGFARAKDIDSKRGYDAVKKKLTELAGGVAKPDESKRRKLYVAAERIDRLAELTSTNYVETLLKDRFKLVRGITDIGDLNESDLVNLLRTINSRIAEKERPAVVTVAPKPQPF